MSIRDTGLVSLKRCNDSCSFFDYDAEPDQQAKVFFFFSFFEVELNKQGVSCSCLQRKVSVSLFFFSLKSSSCATDSAAVVSRWTVIPNAGEVRSHLEISGIKL